MDSHAALENANGVTGGGVGAKTRDTLPTLSTQLPSDPVPRSSTDSNRYPNDSADDESDTWASAVTSPASVTSPPYWMVHGNGHRRSISNQSAESIVPIGAITMRDNEASGRDERNKACWAKSVSITDHVIVNGSATNIGAFVVWTIRVETLQGSYMNICKRYSEFDDLRHRLMMTFPDFEAAVPPLPPKSVISKFRPSFLDKRRQGLQYFLNCIMLNPEFSGSPILKEFLFTYR